mmetsp:Transcript_35487/g.81218  ORF Transcript_35487/g.81218 Transcript_35487/m.81218 type:complete len:223 (+) Transcript_35487:274-942(+)
MAGHSSFTSLTCAYFSFAGSPVSSRTKGSRSSTVRVCHSSSTGWNKWTSNRPARESDACAHRHLIESGFSAIAANPEMSQQLPIEPCFRLLGETLAKRHRSCLSSSSASPRPGRAIASPAISRRPEKLSSNRGSWSVAPGRMVASRHLKPGTLIPRSVRHAMSDSSGEGAVGSSRTNTPRLVPSMCCRWMTHASLTKATNQLRCSVCRQIGRSFTSLSASRL